MCDLHSNHDHTQNHFRGRKAIRDSNQAAHHIRVRVTRDVGLIACSGVWRVVAVTPETDLDDPADEDGNGEYESVDRVKVSEKEAYGVDEGVNKADEWEESGIEDEPAAGLVSRQVTRLEAGAQGKTRAKNRSCESFKCAGTDNVKLSWGITYAIVQCLACECANLLSSSGAWYSCAV